MALITVTALGTRGDVQPLALLSWQIAHKAGNTGSQVAFITHAAHQAWLEDLLRSTAIQLLYVDSTPAAVWQHQDSSSPHEAAGRAGRSCCRSASSHTAVPHASTCSHQEATTRLQLLQHCCTAFHFSLPKFEQGQVHGHQIQQEELSEQHHQHQQQQQRLVIFNLFALECYHIAEALQVPCIVAQPYLVPYAMPAGFQRRFSRLLPGLALRLQANNGQQGVSWADVSHWMWPLFTDRWGPWRQETLGLQALPLLQAVQEGWTGCTYRALAGSSSSSAAIADAAQQLPASIPVLYGLSPNVVSRPGYWPASVQLTGFWLVSDLHAQRVWQQQQQQQQQQCGEQKAAVTLHHCRQQQQQQTGCKLPEPLQSFIADVKPQCMQQHRHPAYAAGSQHGSQHTTHRLGANSMGHKCSGGILLVDFGSMGCLGLLRDAELLLYVVLEALEQLNWVGVLVTGGWQQLAEVYRKLSPAARQQLLLQHDAISCHHLLLSQVDVVLQHGGSGTTAAALAAGVPQLICPLQFDQFYWAERIAHLGCSPAAAVSVEKLLPHAGGVNSTQPAQVAAEQVMAAGEAAEAPVRTTQQQVDARPGSQQQQTSGAAASVPSGLTAAAAAASPPAEQHDIQMSLDQVQTEKAVATAAAGSYLAAQVLAARDAGVIDACVELQQGLAQEHGLQAAATLVMQHCRDLLTDGHQLQHCHSSLK